MSAAVRLRRRTISIAPISAARPTAARATPTPRPAFAPVDRPFAVKALVVCAGADAVLVGVVRAGGEDAAAVFDDVVEVSQADMSLIFQPTTAMAPTVDAESKVVVASVHEVESVPVDW